MGFIKLDCGILNSSVWPDKTVRSIWITALLMAEPRELREPTPTLRVRKIEPDSFIIPVGWYGFVPASSLGIIRYSDIDHEAGLSALETLASPDEASRSQEFEGRRMVRIDGGFIILNYDKYREKDYSAAERCRRYRERKAAGQVSAIRRHAVSTRNNTQAEAEAEAEAASTSRGTKYIRRTQGGGTGGGGHLR